MLYYEGQNVFIWLGAVAFFVFMFIMLIQEPKERIIGYEIDEMRTPTGETRFDTVSVIIRKGDSIFIKDRGLYTFIPKENNNVGTLEKAGQESAVNKRPAFKAKK